MDLNLILDRFATAANDLYAKDGELVPMLAVKSPRIDLSCQLPGSMHPGDNAERLLARLGAMIEVTAAAFMVESWMQRFDADIDVDTAMEIPRGHLEKLAASGDPTVETALVVVVTDGESWQTRCTRASDGEVITAYYSPMADGLRDALAFGRRLDDASTREIRRELAHLDEDSLAEVLGEGLIQAGLAVGVVLAGNAWERFN